MVLVSVVVGYAIDASEVVGAVAFSCGVHGVAVFPGYKAFLAVVGVWMGVVFFVVKCTAEAAVFAFLAVVCGVFKAPTVSALGDGWGVLEGTEGAVVAKGCKCFLFKEKEETGCGFVG